MIILHKNRLAALLFSLILLICFTGMAWADNDTAAYLNRLKSEMAAPAMQGQLPMDNLAQIEAALDTMDSWAKLLNQASRHEFTVEEYATVTAFKEQVRVAQGKLFPMLRQASAFAMQNAMPKYKVTTKDEGAVKIWFTSPLFKDMDATREVLETYGLLFKRLRLAQIDFMLDHEDVSTLSRFKPPQDTDIVLWSDDYSRYSLFN